MRSLLQIERRKSYRVLMLAVASLLSGSTPARAYQDGAAQDAKPAAASELGSWAQWRGPLATGANPSADPPLSWSEDKNVRWKTALPGKGHSTPIVWKDRIFVTAAVPYGEALEPAPDTAPGAHDNAPVTHRQDFTVLCLDRATGGVVWQRSLHKELPHERAHYTAGFASNSPATDGERVYAFFGSRGLYCLDFNGETLWSAQLGKMQVKHAHGEGSSPVLHGNSLVVNWDHEGESFVVAFDKRTGEERWRVERDEATSWASPIVVEHDGKAQLIVSGSNRLRSYDLATGEVVWECGGLSHNVVATPVASDGMVFAGSSYDRQSMLAIRLDGAKGDVGGGDNLVWVRRKMTPYVPSPLLYDGVLYFLRHYQGILCRVDARTGQETVRPRRLSGIEDVYASPVAAAGRIYVTDLDGTTLVLSHEADPKVLARNQLDDRISASVALVDREIFVRGEHFLYCIAEE